MFVLDTSLDSIEADEADVIEIHRSDEPLPVGPGKLPPRPCNAYLCVVRRNDAIQVYAILEQVDRKKSFVYRPDPPPPANASVDRLAREAGAFLAELGFSLREVNLKYSKAMREVVIRDIRVIRKPAAVPLMDRAVVGEEAKLPAEAPPPTEEAAAAAVAAAAPEPAARVAEMAAEAQRLGAEKETAEKAWAEKQTWLAAEIERLRRERDELLRLAEVEGGALQAEAKRLEAEVARLAAEKQKTEREAAERAEELRKEVERLTAERTEVERVVAPDLEELRREVAMLEAGVRKAGEAALRSRERLAAEVERLEGEQRQLEADAGAEEKAAGERIDALTAEIGRVTASREQAAKTAAERIAGLEGEAGRLAETAAAEEARLAADVSALEEVVARRSAELEAARAGAVDRLARLVADAELLSAERAAVERVIAAKGGASAEFLAKAAADVSALKDEVERLAAARALDEQTAAARIAALQTEVARLSARKGAKPEEAAPPPPPSDRVPPPAAAEGGTEVFKAGWDKEVGSAVDALLNGGGEADPFAFMGGGGNFTSFGAPGPAGGDEAPAHFRLDKSLDCIEYGAAAEVLELHQTLNMVTISPEGHKPQSCGAYICALKRGAGFRVYVAWSLEADRKTLVYSPEKHPSTPDECAKAVRDAFAFVETVGFMMDAVSLPANPEKRARALAKVPVLCRKG